MRYIVNLYVWSDYTERTVSANWRDFELHSAMRFWNCTNTFKYLHTYNGNRTDFLDFQWQFSVCTLQNSYRKPWKLFCLKNWFLSTLKLLLYELIKITELRFLNIAQPLMAFWRLKIELEPKYYGNKLNSISFKMCPNHREQTKKIIL